MLSISPICSGLLCGILAAVSVTAMTSGLSALERAYPHAFGDLNRVERERFLRALDQCRKAFVIAGYGLAVLEAVLLGILTFGEEKWWDAMGLATVASALPVGYFVLLVRCRNKQLREFLDRVRKNDGAAPSEVQAIR